MRAPADASADQEEAEWRTLRQCKSGGNRNKSKIAVGPQACFYENGFCQALHGIRDHAAIKHDDRAQIAIWIEWMAKAR